MQGSKAEFGALSPHVFKDRGLNNDSNNRNYRSLRCYIRC